MTMTSQSQCKVIRYDNGFTVTVQGYQTWQWLHSHSARLSDMIMTSKSQCKVTRCDNGCTLQALSQKSSTEGPHPRSDTVLRHLDKTYSWYRSRLTLDFTVRQCLVFDENRACLSDTTHCLMVMSRLSDIRKYLRMDWGLFWKWTIEEQCIHIYLIWCIGFILSLLLLLLFILLSVFFCCFVLQIDQDDHCDTSVCERSRWKIDVTFLRRRLGP